MTWGGFYSSETAALRRVRGCMYHLSLVYNVLDIYLVRGGSFLVFHRPYYLFLADGKTKENEDISSSGSWLVGNCHHAIPRALPANLRTVPVKLDHKLVALRSRASAIDFSR